MSEVKHILTFTLRNELFAVDAMAVREIVLLPELTPVEEVPEYIVGVFNLRGHIVPVMDLNLRFGHAPERYSISDRVIILEIEGDIMGIIVSDVHDVATVPVTDIEPSPRPHLIAGEAKVGEEIIMLLDHNNLVGGWELSPLPQGEGQGAGGVAEATAEELTIFRDRARILMQPLEEVGVAGRIPLAVVSLNGEYFGIDLEVIKEFANVRGVTPVPCTPAHIVGDMNLRGDILTIVDIGGILNVATKGKGGKAVISQVNDLVAGVAVDDVIEVINLSPSDVRPVPASVEAVGNEYIRGEFPYQGKMLSILDMKKVLTSKEMVVGEEA